MELLRIAVAFWLAVLLGGLWGFRRCTTARAQTLLFMITMTALLCLMVLGGITVALALIPA